MFFRFGFIGANQMATENSRNVFAYIEQQVIGDQNELFLANSIKKVNRAL